MAKRVSYLAEFKSRVGIEALKDHKTLSNLAQKFKLHLAQITRWKTQALRGICQLFEDGRSKKKTEEIDIEALYAQIGKLQAQLEFLKKNRWGTIVEKRKLLEPDHPILSIEAQCEALGLSRSSYYYRPFIPQLDNVFFLRL